MNAKEAARQIWLKQWEEIIHGRCNSGSVGKNQQEQILKDFESCLSF